MCRNIIINKLNMNKSTHGCRWWWWLYVQRHKLSLSFVIMLADNKYQSMWWWLFQLLLVSNCRIKFFIYPVTQSHIFITVSPKNYQKRTIIYILYHSLAYHSYMNIRRRWHVLKVPTKKLLRKNSVVSSGNFIKKLIH